MYGSNSLGRIFPASLRFAARKGLVLGFAFAAGCWPQAAIAQSNTQLERSSAKWEAQIVTAEEGTRANVTSNGGTVIGGPPGAARQKWLAVHVRLKPPQANRFVDANRFTVALASDPQTKYPALGVTEQTGKTPTFVLFEHLAVRDATRIPPVTAHDLSGEISFMTWLFDGRPGLVFMSGRSATLRLLFAVPSKAKFPYLFQIDDGGGVRMQLEKKQGQESK